MTMPPSENNDGHIASPNAGIADSSNKEDILNSSLLGAVLEATNLLRQYSKEHRSGDFYFQLPGNLENVIIGDNGTINSNNIPNPHPTPISPSPGIQAQLDDMEDFEKFRDWYFQLADTDRGFEKQAHVIAVAMFPRNSWNFILVIRNAVEEIILEVLGYEEPSPEEKAKDRELNPPPAFGLRSTHQPLLNETFTMLDTEYYSVESGLTSARVVRFIEPYIRENALRLLGESLELMNIRLEFNYRILSPIAILMSDSSLSQLGSFQSSITRMQAATTIGILAKYDYSLYLESVIRPWSNSYYTRPSVVLAWVLLTLYGYEDYNSHIISLVKHWAGVSNEQMQWTSAYVARYLGWVDIENTLKALKRTIVSSDEQVRLISFESIAILYYTASNLPAILTHLALWVSEKPGEGKNDPLIRQTIRIYQLLIAGPFIDNLAEIASLEDKGTFSQEVENDTTHTASKLDDHSSTRSKSKEVNIWQLIHNAKQSHNFDMTQVEQGIITLTQFAITTRTQSGSRYYEKQMREIIEDWFKQGEKNVEYRDTITTILQGVVRSTAVRDWLQMLTEVYSEWSSIAAQLHRELLEGQHNTTYEDYDEWSKSVDDAWNNIDDSLDIRKNWLDS